MNWVADRLAEGLSECPDHPFLFDERLKTGVSWRRIDDATGRIYAFLLGRGIAREDVVLVKLPRCAAALVALLGVWRAGAVAVLVEETYAPERVEFIRRDSGAKLVFDPVSWDSAMRLDPRAGAADVGPHDAAYLVYTSGTTGTPKGVVHEYGNLPESGASMVHDGRPIIAGDDRFALNSPLNFVATNIFLLTMITRPRGQVYVVPYATLKSPQAFARYLDEMRITCTFLAPAFVRKFGSRPGAGLRTLLLAGEPANGIAPDPRVAVYNLFGMSESGFVICAYRMERPEYPCSIGRPGFARRVLVLDDGGHEVADGEVGELCFEAEYVRGYVNLPEETAQTFRGGFCRSGDLAKRLPSGDFVLSGRKTDMVKINGNRVEPAEVEVAVRETLGLGWCAVRGFEGEDGNFLAAYFTDAVEIDEAAAREALSRRLPYYMIPRHFVRIDKMPVGANGKMLRRLLPRPEVSRGRTGYVAPRTATEKALCAAMAATLGLERVGVNDDFYALGGDSIGSLEVVLAVRLDGFDASAVYRGRTPARIAAEYDTRRGREGDVLSDDELNERAKRRPHPLNPSQAYMFDYQCYTPMSTMYNTFALFRAERGRVDAVRFAAAMERAIRNHPAFLTMLSFGDDGDVLQAYRPEEVDVHAHVERITEFDCRQIVNGLVRPYKLIGSRLFRTWLAETERAFYWFFDVHHIMSDGTAFQTLVRDVIRAYEGQPLGTDYYYLLLDRQERAAKSAHYDESRRYFESAYGGGDWVSMPPPDHVTRDNDMGTLLSDMGVTRAELEDVARRTQLSRNEFFVTAFGLALAIRTKSNRVQYSWLYNGRSDAQSVSTCGLLFHDMPVALDLGGDPRVADLCADVRRQVELAIAHCDYPYNEISQDIIVGDTPCVVYQNDILSLGPLGKYGFKRVDIPHNGVASESVMEVMIGDDGEGFCLDVDYASSRYDEPTIRSLRDCFLAVCRFLVDHVGDASATFGSVRAAVAGTEGRAACAS